MFRRLKRCSRISILFFFILTLSALSGCKSIQTPDDTVFPNDGLIRLEINEKTGGFSIYGLIESQRNRYEPLFNAGEQSASYASININGKVQRLGSGSFKPSLEWQDGKPVLQFGSSDITVTQTFTPVRTAGSISDNGVMITYNIYNNGSQSVLAGLRVLLDTTLGEQSGMVHFITENQTVANETKIEGNAGRYWISRGRNVSLMGSIANPLSEEINAAAPDYVHFANWKRLNDSSWALDYSGGRTFNSDSAVCYFFLPVLLESGASITFVIFLTTEDSNWDISVSDRQTAGYEENAYLILNEEPSRAAVTASPAQESAALNIDIAAIEKEALAAAVLNNENAEIQTLKMLQDILVRFINGEINLGEQDLLEIERAIERLRD